MRFAEAKRKLYRPFPAFSFSKSLRSLQQFAAPHLAGARHSATAKTLHTRGDAGCTKAANLGYALQLEQVESIAPVWQTTFSRPQKASLVRRAITKQSSGHAYHGQIRAQCYNAAVERAQCYIEAVGRVCLPWSGMRAVVGRVCLPWSGVRTVLYRSSRAGVLTMVRHARSAVTKHLPWSGLL